MIQNHLIAGKVPLAPSIVSNYLYSVCTMFRRLKSVFSGEQLLTSMAGTMVYLLRFGTEHAY